MSFRIIASMLVVLLSIYSCGSEKKLATTSEEYQHTEEPAKEKTYNASSTKDFDLIHTKLDVSFDWENKLLAGTAEITLKPHFYTSNILNLNARGFLIEEVKLVKGDSKEEVAYSYANDSITIVLDKYYTRFDTLTVYINYTAAPDLLKKGGTTAITNDKGLYFINADGSDPYKPKQIWTQGETESNSAWFPTIDRPNQKSTEEIYITVDTAYVTLSNGTLVSSIVNSYNGTRTDYWRQTQPHAPYLFMMAVGKFAVVKDKWRNKEVSYYVEPEYEKYARDIFAHTPEMIEFFSTKLGVDFVWDKYAQIIVRDYVSGAMENTSATVFGEFVQKDKRSLLDGSNDDIISHELFHQWFGDLVTTESWSNITLNEGFASYGEYLWNENKYGRDEADHGLRNDLNSYLNEARSKQVNLVRFDYDHHMEMFDRHSYQKGSRVIHMLRTYVGDEAFFASLKLYLTAHAFQSVEIHDLRLAFESVTGEDLNWFFNQWFLDKGHPQLKIEYDFDEANKKQYVNVRQAQSLESTPLYKLPLDIDIYTNSGVKRYPVIVEKENQTFEFDVDSKPFLVNFDAQKMLLCTKLDKHSTDEFVEMYNRAPLYLDRYEALTAITKSYKSGTPESEVVKKALNDPFWNIRSLAIERSDELIAAEPELIKNILLDLLVNDPKSSVRVSALEKLTESYKSDATVLQTVQSKSLHDSSYSVIESAIEYIMEVDPTGGLSLIKKMETEGNENIKNLVFTFYTQYGDDKQYDFMTSTLLSDVGYSAHTTVESYGKYLMRCSPSTAFNGLDNISSVAKNHSQWFVRLAAAQALARINHNYGESELKSSDSSQNSNSVLEQRTTQEIYRVRNKAGDLLDEAKAQETDPNLTKIYNPKQ